MALKERYHVGSFKELKHLEVFRFNQSWWVKMSENRAIQSEKAGYITINFKHQVGTFEPTQRVGIIRIV